MNLVFLSGRLPLTKTFAMTQGVLAATPYPHIARVTSHHEEVSSLAEFHSQLVAHARQGHCLFGGQLTRPLKQESRAGMTTKEGKSWLVFDFDRVEGKDHADVVKRYLPKECHDISYIAQLSASMFRPDTTSWSGHIFILLDRPVDEQRVRQWFEYLNFSNPALTGQIKLSDSEQALHWPLDRTVAYNSKLIFIAPPKCYGFEPAVKESIVLVTKKKAQLKFPEFTPVDNQTIRQKVNELRRDIGLDEISYAMTQFEGQWVLDQTGECTIHDIKTSGDHYIRFNLNGGDSYAYFIDLRKPDLIRNFKGEPFLKTEEAAPDLWKSLRKIAPRAVSRPALEEGTEVLAFYATNQASMVKIGLYDHGAHALTLNNSGERAAKAWQAEYGVVGGGMLQHMDLVFDPHCDVQYVTGATQINLFKATPYMTRERTNPKPSKMADMPALTDRIMRSMLGNPTDEVYKHFLNWLAFMFQFRRKPATAWVMSGVEGTGKGTFVKYILTPLFGQSAVKVVQYGLLNQEFNDFLEHALFVVFEEADVNAADNNAALMAKLRHMITDSEMMIRRMRTDPYPAETYFGCLFFSNKKTPVMTASHDRRFNIAEWQDARLFFTPNEYALLQAGSELDSVADLLQRWPVDMEALTRVVDTEARQRVHEATSSINQLIADAVLAGDLQFFIDRMPSDAEANSDFHNRFNPIGMFQSLLDDYIDKAEAGVPVVIKDQDLFVLFRTLIPDARYFQDSKTWRKRHYKSLGLEVDKQVRVPGEWNQRERGLLITWNKPEDTPLRKGKAAADTQVVPIRKPKAAKK